MQDATKVVKAPPEFIWKLSQERLQTNWTYVAQNGRHSLFSQYKNMITRKYWLILHNYHNLEKHKTEARISS